MKLDESLTNLNLNSNSLFQLHIFFMEPSSNLNPSPPNTLQPPVSGTSSPSTVKEKDKSKAKATPKKRSGPATTKSIISKKGSRKKVASPKQRRRERDGEKKKPHRFRPETGTSCVFLFNVLSGSQRNKEVSEVY